MSMCLFMSNTSITISTTVWCRSGQLRRFRARSLPISTKHSGSGSSGLMMLRKKTSESNKCSSGIRVSYGDCFSLWLTPLLCSLCHYETICVSAIWTWWACKSILMLPAEYKGYFLLWIPSSFSQRMPIVAVHCVDLGTYNMHKIMHIIQLRFFYGLKTL